MCNQKICCWIPGPGVSLEPSPECPSGTYTCEQTSGFDDGPDNSRWNMQLALETLNTNSIQAYTDAVGKWQRVITGNRPAVDTSVLSERYNPCARPYPKTIDDLYICGRDVPIDGEGRILGRAGPIYTNSNSGRVLTGEQSLLSLRLGCNYDSRF